MNKELPNKNQLKRFIKQERNERKLSKTLLNVIKEIPKKSHPMDVARTAVSVMGLEDKDTTNNSQEAFTKAKEIANAGDCIVAFGSLYIAAEFVELIKNIKPEYYIYE